MRGVGFVLYFSLTGQDHSPQQGGVSITEETVQHAPFAKPHLRANDGCRHCFAHSRALITSGCQSPDFYASINPSSDTRWLNCSRKEWFCGKKRQ